MLKIFHFCKKYLSENVLFLYLYVVLCIFSSLFSLLLPITTGNFIDMLASYSSFRHITYYCTLFIIINLLQIISGYFSGRLYTKLQMNMGYSFNRDMIQHMQRVSLRYLKTKDAAYLSQRINNDTNNLVIFCIGVVQNVIINLLTLLFPLMILYQYNASISWAVAGMVLLYFISYRLTRQPLYGVNLKFQEAQSAFFSRLNEQLKMAKFIKLQAIAETFISRLQSSFDHLLSAALRRQKISYLFTSLDGMIATLMQIGLFFIGGYAVIQGDLTIGQFTVVSTYFSMLLSAVRYFFGLGKTVQESRIKELQDIPEQVWGDKTIEKISTITVSDLSFGYEGKQIFTRYNLEFIKGNLYAIVGDNGSGKSTLINLLMGIYTGEFEGEIFYNHIPLQQLNLPLVLRNQMGIAEQEPSLLAASLAYNLTLDEQMHISRDNIEELSAILGLQDFFSQLPQGLDSQVNTTTDNLSGGEKQKIAIMRSLLKDPDVLILDEPTSAMDYKSQKEFINYLYKIKNEKIIIMISHDFSIVDKCDFCIKL